MPEVLLATGNPHKLDEVRAVLEPIGWRVLGLDDLEGPTPPEPVEDAALCSIFPAPSVVAILWGLSAHALASSLSRRSAQ